MTHSDLSSAQNSKKPLDEVLRAIRGMKNDPLSGAGRTMVIGGGTPGGRWGLVGEVRGPQEKIQGRPLAGLAGKLWWRV